MQQAIDARLETAGTELIKPDKAGFGLIEGDQPEFRSARAAALYRYWATKRADGKTQRGDIEPAEIKALLPYVLIVDLQENPFRIYYRLVGTAVAHFSGLDFTGYFLDELAFDICSVEDLTKAYRKVAETGKPGIGMAFTQITHHSALDVEYLICPLFDAAGKVTQCLVLEDYVDKRGIDKTRLRLARPA